MFEVDASVGLVTSWDFSVKAQGKVYTTVAPTLADLIFLERVQKGQIAVADLAAWGQRVFGDNGPDVKSWGIDVFMEFMREYSTYFFEWSAKRAGKLQAPKPQTPAN